MNSSAYFLCIEVFDVRREKEKRKGKEKRNIELAREKGASAWLSAVPIKSLGFVLNKQEFRDSIFLRYGWNIPDTPAYCQCGQKNSVDHTLSCPNGGYTVMRHNYSRSRGRVDAGGLSRREDRTGAAPSR